MKTQKRDKLILVLRKVRVLTRDEDPVLGVVDCEVARLENAGIRHSLASDGRSRVADGRADPCQQLTGSKRLCEIIIRARIQRLDLVSFMRPGGDDHDRHLRPAPDLAQNLHPVHVRKAQIENDHIRTVRGDHALSHRARAGEQDVIIVRREHRLHEVADGLLVFNYQNFLSDFHLYAPPMAV